MASGTVYQRMLNITILFPKTILTIVISLFVFLWLSFPGWVASLSLHWKGDFAVDTRVLTGSNLNTIANTQKAAYTGYPISGK